MIRRLSPYCCISTMNPCFCSITGYMDRCSRHGKFLGRRFGRIAAEFGQRIWSNSAVGSVKGALVSFRRNHPGRKDLSGRADCWYHPCFDRGGNGLYTTAFVDDFGPMFRDPYASSHFAHSRAPIASMDPFPAVQNPGLRRGIERDCYPRIRRPEAAVYVLCPSE